MELFDKIKLNYNPIHVYDLVNLNQEEWIQMIKYFCEKLAERKNGRILVDKLIQFIDRGFNITVSNNDFKFNSTIYPKIRYDGNNVFIVIPSVPYFTSVQVIDKELVSESDIVFIQNLERITMGFPSNVKLDFDDKDKHYDYNFLVSWEIMSGFLGFAHELIHTVRYFENYDIDGRYEEDNTIYGYDRVLSYVINGEVVYMTENSIRMDWDIKPRVSHDCKEIFCYGMRNTYKNANNFTKEDFFKLV